MNLPRLSPASEQVMARAGNEATELGHGYLGVEHVFIALMTVGGPRVVGPVTAQDIEIPALLSEVREALTADTNPGTAGTPTYTRRTTEVVRLAGKVAQRGGAGLVEPPHLLEAILGEGRSVPARTLRAVGIDAVELQHALARPVEHESDASLPILSKLGRDLTELARDGRLSPLVGRKDELDLACQVLLRRNKNNPVLVGEAGVGKTAVVEGLAQLLVSDDCPAPLRGHRIIELSMGSLVAGTKYRGEFEERLLGVIAELLDNPDLILFVDEIHTVVGAGSASGDALDASNIIKPALARGEIRCVGATTIDEYRRYIEKDAALERRFEKVQIDEPTPGETVEILERLKPLLEAHHQVTIEPEALHAAVSLTVRHVADRQLPDKALDALDQTCARARLVAHTGDGDGSAAAIGEPDVVHTVSQWTGIPLERTTPDAARELLNLADDLKNRVIGQDVAAEAVARSIVTARAGLAPADRPLGVFLFMGPTGVGKTELAKGLADCLFGDPARMVRFDMSEFAEPHSVAKLIGAPPGYVGYEREGELVSQLRTRPHCVVLFDEIEKAHPKVFDIFLQIFDDGRLTGAHGRTADFTQAVVIMTSNLVPAAPEPEKRGLGFVAEEPSTEAPQIDLRLALTGFLRPELVNRIDEIVLFRPLGVEELSRIVSGYVREITDTVAARGIELNVDDSVLKLLVAFGSTEHFGARELRRVVDRQLRQPLAQALLARGGDGVVRVTVEDDRVRIVYQSRSE